VLQFFRRHPQPVNALREAQQEFGMTRPEVLQLLARTGVTEAEVYGGDIPDAGQLWQRLRDRSRHEPMMQTPGRARPGPRDTVPPAAPESSASGWGEFGADLEGLLNSSASAPGTPQRAGKRPAPEQPDDSGRWVWGTQRARSQRARPELLPPEDIGLADPGAPTADDLAALSQGGFGPMNESMRDTGIELEDLAALAALGTIDLSELLHFPDSPPGAGTAPG